MVDGGPPAPHPPPVVQPTVPPVPPMQLAASAAQPAVHLFNQALCAN